MVNVVLPDNKDRSLAFFLAMEEFVARKIEGEAFFVWRVEPTVIFGRNQVLENEVNLEYCRERGVEIVQRKSGGGCVYSDKGNIMISYVSGRGVERGVVSDVFEKYLNELTSCLCSLGLDAEKSGRNDILVGGRKVSGNAFHQLPDRSIVHGTLLYDTDMDALEISIKPPVEKLERHGVASVRQRVRNIAELLEQNVQHNQNAQTGPNTQAVKYHPALKSVEALEKYIVEYFTDGEIRLSEEDVAAIEDMAKPYIVNI